MPSVVPLPHLAELNSLNAPVESDARSERFCRCPYVRNATACLPPRPVTRGGLLPAPVHTYIPFVPLFGSVMPALFIEMKN